jgi:hypothetical protein
MFEVWGFRVKGLGSRDSSIGARAFMKRLASRV